MVIALLIAIGVNIAVVVALAVLVLGRRRWLRRQPGAFTGAIRVVQGDVHGLGSSWRRGSGRWVRDILVWNRAPFMYRNAVVPIDGLAARRQPAAGEVRRIGDEPTIFILEHEGARIELAAALNLEGLATGPFSLEQNPVEENPS